MSENEEKIQFQIGDTVIIKTGDLNKQAIGKVEDIKFEQKILTYYEYLRPEEIPGGRKPYHGKNELIKSDRIVEANIDDVVSKCHIYRMKDYIVGKHDQSIPAFVFRQYFDATNKKLMPENLESQYFGEKVPNPDEELKVNSYSHGDENFLGESYDEELMGKRKGASGTMETVIPLKKSKAGFDFTSFGDAKEQHPKQEKKAPKRVTDRQKVVSMKVLTMNAEEKKQEAFLKKADQKALQLLEKFKQSMQLSFQLPEQERIRQKVRENFFYSLVFGLEEMRLKTEQEHNEDFQEHTLEATRLLSKDEKSQIEHIKNLTLSIEANLYHKYNKEVSRTSDYNNKSRFIFMNLKHKKNFDLRLRILTEDVSPSQLCSMTEDELAPKSVKKERKEEKDKYLTSKLIKEDEITNVKSKKGEMLVGAPEDNGLPPVSIEAEFTARAAKKNQKEQKEAINEEDEEEEALKDISSNSNKVDKQGRDIMEELDPKIYAEKAEQRFKEYLPEEAANNIIKGLKS